MEKDKFKNNLQQATHLLIRLAKAICINSFSTKYRFRVKPNVDGIDDHLDQEEIRFHNKIVDQQGKYFSEQEVVDLLWSSDKVPLWINTSIQAAIADWTTIELLTSRRLRAEEELNHIVDQYPPFHIAMPVPPDLIDGEKFDVNWRYLGL